LDLSEMSNFSNASFGGFLKPQSEPAHLLVGGGGWGEVNPMTLNPMALPPLHAHQHGADSISAGRGGANAGALDTVLEGHETPLSSEGEQLQAASLWPLNPSALESAWDEAVMSTSVHLDFLKRSTGIEMPSRPVGLCASPLRIPQNPSYFLLFPAGACLYGHLSLATPTLNGVDALDAVDYFYLTCRQCAPTQLLTTWTGAMLGGAASGDTQGTRTADSTHLTPRLARDFSTGQIAEKVQSLRDSKNPVPGSLDLSLTSKLEAAAEFLRGVKRLRRAAAESDEPTPASVTQSPHEQPSHEQHPPPGTIADNAPRLQLSARRGPEDAAPQPLSLLPLTLSSAPLPAANWLAGLFSL